MKTSFARPAVACLVGSLLIACSAFAQPYKLIDLGANVGPAALNDSDVIVGAVSDPALPPPSNFRPFIWRDGVLTHIDVPGWTIGSLLGINSAGTAVGQLGRGNPVSQTAPYIYQDGAITFIPLPSGAVGGAANAINDSGVIGGFVAGPIGQVPFIYQDGAVTLLPTPGGISGAGGVDDISSSGVAIGEFHIVGSPYSQPFEWQNSTMTFLTGLGPQVGVQAINDAGVIIGYSSIGTEGLPHLVVWENGNVRDLSVLSDAIITTGLDINNSGVIVGYAVVGPGPATPNAFLFRNNAFETLDSLMSASTGWHFTLAEAINGRGDIVGWGYPPGATEQHGFLLVAQKTVAELATELAAAIAADGLRPSQAQALLSLLSAYERSGGANQHALCIALDRFVRKAPSFGLTTQETDRLIELATDLSRALGC